MLWRAIDTPQGEPSVYRSEQYDLVHSVAGFGMSLVKVYPRSGNHKVLKEFAGHNALKQAQDWCAASFAELDSKGRAAAVDMGRQS